LGHIVIGDEIVRDAVEKLGDFPAEKAIKLRHLILSHQGTLEQASPVVPMMPEGYALYAADLLDSKLSALRRIRKKEKRPGVEWSSFVKLLNTFLYFGSEEEENG
jgi:3'-5' exoribonuclease